MERQSVLAGMAKFLKTAGVVFVIAFVCSSFLSLGMLYLEHQALERMAAAERMALELSEPEPFPVSVIPSQKLISPDPLAAAYLTKELTVTPEQPEAAGWLTRLYREIITSSWLQNLASPIGRIFVIWPGQRQEEIVDHIGDILRWDTTERTAFTTLMASSTPELVEGNYYPGTYETHKDATPKEIAALLGERFEYEVLARYTEDVAAVVPLEDALIIASLLEREAAGAEDIREISGIIWNRLFINMNLQLDATLQYVKGSRPYERSWWPRVIPRDKYLNSPYNTYEYAGLPPAPIGNPSAEAVYAALNPVPTDCLYYFHDDEQNFHCSVTYEEHVASLRAIYGRGR